MTRRLAAEFMGTAILLAAIVGSGIMGVKLSGGSAGLALLVNSLATGAILFVLITIFGPISGAHFNPAVTLVMTFKGMIEGGTAAGYAVAQVLGGICGVICAHAMFDLPLLQVSETPRAGTGQWIAEIFATFGLIITIFGTLRTAPTKVPISVGLYILSAYWFTASTSFANPAVTLARAFTNTFAGIALHDVIGFILAQLAGALAGYAVSQWLFCENAKSR